MGFRPPPPPPSRPAVVIVRRVVPLDAHDPAVFLAWCEEGGPRTLSEFCHEELVRAPGEAIEPVRLTDGG